MTTDDRLFVTAVVHGIAGLALIVAVKVLNRRDDRLNKERA